MPRILPALAIAGATTLGFGMVAGLSHVSGGFALAGPPGTCCPVPKDQSRLPQGYTLAPLQPIPVKTVTYSRADYEATRPKKKRKRKYRRARR